MATAYRAPSTWGFLLTLDTRLIEPPVVQWALFARDPASRFEQDLRVRRHVYRERLGDAQDAEAGACARLAFLRTRWDHLFRDVTGEDVYLLGLDVPQGVMSDATPGRKWIVTKAIGRHGALHCWSVAFEAVAGRVVEVRLHDGNATELTGRLWRVLGEGLPCVPEQRPPGRGSLVKVRGVHDERHPELGEMRTPSVGFARSGGRTG